MVPISSMTLIHIKVVKEKKVWLKYHFISLSGTFQPLTIYFQFNHMPGHDCNQQRAALPYHYRINDPERDVQFTRLAVIRSQIAFKTAL